MTDIRVGNGYDVHRLTHSRRLIIGGVDIPFDKGLEGHSDADVLTHAIIDSLFGAAALPDIGTHFPDTDPQYKGVDSILLLKRTADIIKKKGYSIGNIDSIIVAQHPKMMPYISSMRGIIANALSLDIDRISIKATTEEKLGFTGAGEGISAYSTALIFR